MCWEIRRCLGCLAVVLCAGPIMLIVGIVFLCVPNHQSSELVSWQNAINTYTLAFRPMMQQTSGAVWTSTSGQYALTGTTRTVAPTNGASTTSYYLTANSLPTAQNGIYTFNVTLANNGSQVANTFSTNAATQGSSTKRTIYCNTCSGCSCSYSWASNQCNYGTYNAYAGYCYNGNACGYCLTNYYLSTVCAPVSLQTNAQQQRYWAASTSASSCFYPFTTQLYQAGNSAPYSVTTQVMSDQDPYIALQRITGGGNGFGISGHDQHNVGVGLTIAGIVVTFFMVWAAVRICRSRNNNACPPETVVVVAQPGYGPMNNTVNYEPVATAGMMPPPGYGVAPGYPAPYPAPQQGMGYGGQPMYPQQPAYPQPPQQQQVYGTGYTAY